MKTNLKILVVDDNGEFCDNINDILEFKGYHVLTAMDGFKAVDIVKKNKIDLILMDIKMPAMNGVETFKKIKNVAPDIPVIMITAFAVEELIRESLRDGAFGVLKKPIDFDNLFSLIEDASNEGLMILTVDDDENFCKNMNDILSEKGYCVNVAYNSNAAIRMTRENNFDIMFLDLKLPPLNGLETYMAIRDIRPDIVVIIISGYLGEMRNMADEVLKNSAYTCIEKPINMDKLILLVEQIKKQKSEGEIKKPG